MAVERDRGHDEAGNEYWWKNGQWELVNEVSGAEAVLIGAGESFTNLGRGVQQLGLGAGEFLGIDGAREAQAELAQRQAGDQQAMQGLREENPVSTFVGNVLPSVLSAPLGGSSLLGQAALGFGEGALAYGSGQERLQRGAMNAAVVPAIPMAARVSQSIIKSGQEIAQRGLPDMSSGIVGRTINRALESRGKSIADEIAEETGLGRVVDDPSLTGFADDSVGAGRPAGTDGPQVLRNNSNLRVISESMEKPDAVLTNAERQSVQDLIDEGFVLEPGMVDGNKASKLMSESMKSDPIFANTMDDLIQAPNKRNLNKKILEAFGQSGDEITDSTLANIEEKLAAQYDDVFKSVGKDFKLDQKFRDEVRTIGDEFEAGFKSTGASDPVAKRVEKMSEFANNETMSTREYRLFREQLRKLQRTANKADDQNSAEVYGDLVEQMDDQFARSTAETAPDAAKNFGETTQQWRLLNALETGQAIGRDGQIKLGTLSNNLKRNFKREFARDNRFKGEQLPTDEKFLKLFKSVRGLNKQASIIGDSGTSSRNAVQNLFQDPTVAIGKLMTKGFIRRWIKNSQSFKD